MLGLAEGCFERTLPYLHQRKQFGQPIATFQVHILCQLTPFQGMQFQIAQCALEIEAAKLLTYNATRACEMGKHVAMEAAMAKLYASQVAEKVASQCINMMGGVGFTKEFPQEKYYRDCKIGQIYEGTSNMQLQTIAKILEKQYGGK
jgi:short/branched chain acyl-CoA dehydrogenase